MLQASVPAHICMRWVDCRVLIAPLSNACCQLFYRLPLTIVSGAPLLPLPVICMCRTVAQQYCQHHQEADML
jgi:hypothetical protein